VTSYCPKSLGCASDMDPRVFIPIYGPYMEMERVHESEQSFAMKAFDSAAVGAAMGTHMIFAFRHAAHLAAVGEGSAFSLMTVNRMQRVVQYGIPVSTGMIAAGLYGEYAIKPGADVEHGAFGSVRVMPKLGFV